MTRRKAVMKISEIELKPYPWCGKAAQFVNGGRIGFFVECSELGHLHNVGVLGGSLCKNQSKAAADWNKCIEKKISRAD